MAQITVNFFFDQPTRAIQYLRRNECLLALSKPDDFTDEDKRIKIWIDRKGIKTTK